MDRGYGGCLWWLLVAGDGFWFVVGILVVVDSDLWWVCCGLSFFIWVLWSVVV